MTTYLITEKQNINSTREATKVECKNLTAAKRKATNIQMFQGTVLEVESESGETLAVKEKSGKWIEQSYFQ